MFQSKKIKNKTFYYSDLIPAPHAFTTREIVVKDNIELIKEYFSVDRLIKPKQVHSANIEIVRAGVDEYPDCDALILNQNDTAIYLNFADCTPVVLYDIKNNIASAAHAGWRGTAARIAAKTAKKMMETFNSNPSDIVAAIGACIGFSEFETYEEALFELKKSVEDTDGLFKNNYADLKGINARQLEEIGIKKIDICPYCTVLDNDKFFSYRKENKTPLRHRAIIKIK